MNWLCARCHAVHTQNARECRECGHSILEPTSSEELQRRSQGVETPAAADVQTTGTRKRPEYESSPDVDTDGSTAGVSNPNTEKKPKWRPNLQPKVRGTILAPLLLLRDWAIPILAFSLVAIAAYLLVYGVPL